MRTVSLTCIGCPIGCQISVEMDGDNIISVNGNSCKIGDNYARKEVVNPMRIVTSSVAVLANKADPKEGNVKYPRVSVKTASDIPKDKIFDVMDEIKKTWAVAPVQIGDIILHNVAGTGVDVIAIKPFIIEKDSK